jgi:hypothetical protein
VSTHVNYLCRSNDFSEFSEQNCEKIAIENMRPHQQHKKRTPQQQQPQQQPQQYSYQQQQQDDVAIGDYNQYQQHLLEQQQLFMNQQFMNNLHYGQNTYQGNQFTSSATTTPQQQQQPMFFDQQYVMTPPQYQQQNRVETRQPLWSPPTSSNTTSFVPLQPQQQQQHYPMYNNTWNPQQQMQQQPQQTVKHLSEKQMKNLMRMGTNAGINAQWGSNTTPLVDNTASERFAIEQEKIRLEREWARLEQEKKNMEEARVNKEMLKEQAQKEQQRKFEQQRLQEQQKKLEQQRLQEHREKLEQEKREKQQQSLREKEEKEIRQKRIEQENIRRQIQQDREARERQRLAREKAEQEQREKEERDVQQQLLMEKEAKERREAKKIKIKQKKDKEKERKANKQKEEQNRLDEEYAKKLQEQFDHEIREPVSVSQQQQQQEQQQQQYTETNRKQKLVVSEPKSKAAKPAAYTQKKATATTSNQHDKPITQYNGYTLFVRNLPQEYFQKEEFQKLFSTYGTVIACNTFAVKGTLLCGTISYLREGEAITAIHAMHNKKLTKNSKSITVDFDYKTMNKSKASQQTQPQQQKQQQVNQSEIKQSQHVHQQKQATKQKVQNEPSEKQIPKTVEQKKDVQSQKPVENKEAQQAAHPHSQSQQQQPQKQQQQKPVPQKKQNSSGFVDKSNPFNILEDAVEDEPEISKEDEEILIQHQKQEEQKKKSRRTIVEPTRTKKSEPKPKETNTTKSKATPASQEKVQKPCPFFFSSGNCHNGKRCKYSHDRKFYEQYMEQHADNQSDKHDLGEDYSNRKKTRICRHYPGCAMGDRCKFAHLPDASIHEEYKKFYRGRNRDRLCLCSPLNEPPIIYKPGVTQLGPDDFNGDTVLQTLGILFDMSQKELVDNIYLLKKAPEQHRNAMYWFAFPDTAVVFAIQRLAHNDAEHVKELFEYEGDSDDEEDSKSPKQSHSTTTSGTLIIEDLDELEEHETQIAHIAPQREHKATWTILGSMEHQLCVIRYLEEHLPVVFIPGGTENKQYENAMISERATSQAKNDPESYPSLMERITDNIDNYDSDDDEMDEFSDLMFHMFLHERFHRMRGGGFF